MSQTLQRTCLRSELVASCFAAHTLYSRAAALLEEGACALAIHQVEGVKTILMGSHCVRVMKALSFLV
jgi:hypothetical protein